MVVHPLFLELSVGLIAFLFYPVVVVRPLFLELSVGLIVCFPVLSSCGGAPIVFRAVSGPDCFPILSSCGGAPIVFRAVSGPDCLLSYSIYLWWCTNLFNALKGPQKSHNM